MHRAQSWPTWAIAGRGLVLAGWGDDPRGDLLAEVVAGPLRLPQEGPEGRGPCRPGCAGWRRARPGVLAEVAGNAGRRSGRAGGAIGQSTGRLPGRSPRKGDLSGHGLPGAPPLSTPPAVAAARRPLDPRAAPQNIAQSIGFTNTTTMERASPTAHQLPQVRGIDEQLRRRRRARPNADAVGAAPSLRAALPTAQHRPTPSTTNLGPGTPKRSAGLAHEHQHQHQHQHESVATTDASEPRPPPTTAFATCTAITETVSLQRPFAG